MDQPSTPDDQSPTENPDDRSSWTRTLDVAAVPVNALIEKAPPELGDTLAQNVAAALQKALDHSQAMFDPAQLEERLKMARAYPGSDSADYEGHLNAIESSVNSLCADIKKRTILGSCITGFAGAPGQLADIPAFYLYAVHSLQELAVSYGFDPRLEREQKFLLQVLRIGHSPGRKNRFREVDELDKIDIDKDLASLPEISYALTGRGLALLARQLLKTLLRRKAVAMLPVLGAAVNAGINNHLMNAILEVGQRSYRRRFVRRAELIAADRAH
jgi:hypothetical protein